MYELIKESDVHFKVIKNGQHAYNIRFKSKAWSCDCPARKECKHLRMLPAEVQVKRYPREEIEAAYDAIAPLLFPYRHSICGSYRRNKPDSKDLDIIVLCSLADFNQIRMAMPACFVDIAGGETKFTGTLNGIPCDIDRINDPNHYAAALLYRTGPAALNIKMRQIAKEAGWTLNEKVVASSEEDIFKMVGIPYLTPVQRELAGPKCAQINEADAIIAAFKKEVGM
jgi:DNA polymerase/3'-5' exonuclease PolX